MNLTNYDALIKKAIDARSTSYSPYSSFKVGAAIITVDGEIFSGCNIENASFSETVCAERVAIYKAISEGKREFCAIAIVGGKDEISDYTYPCGSCRQALSEFCSDQLEIVLYNGKAMEISTLGALFPSSFKKDDIK